ncbi:AAA family ATPase [Streptomyces sp. NPDC049577]|uniref:AAA family ATPase n=1 Tax=Streptomyces sp. NPDC049577 TaxID=3155153 RepID=UPI00341640FD
MRKCEQAWLEGVTLLRHGNPAAAAQAFETAIGHVPTAADAWLGLHAAGHRQEEALAAMVGHQHSFGELRTKLSIPLSSTFQIGGYVTFRLESARDLWLAGVTRLLDADRLDEAWQLLSTAQLDCDETRFVCTRYALLKKDWRLVLTYAEGISDAFLRDESQLYVASSLVVQDVHHEALDVLAPLPRILGDQAGFRGEVSYLRGCAHEGLGHPEEALKHFQNAFRYSPGLADVAERAKASTPAPLPVPAQAGPPARPHSPDPTNETAAPSPTDETRHAVLDEAMAQLDAMVGLAPVKRQLRTLSAQLRMAAVRRDQGLSTAPALQHFVFAGPPGTGKTTVARIVGQVFAGLGLLERGHVVEAQRVDLVGQHLGETAIKTTKIIDAAMDGVLFIDEAYALANTGYVGGDAYGKEALQVLLKRAEDDRDRLVVILAGYPDEMTELLSTNPGLTSRFTGRVDFPSYSADELVRIARSLLREQGDVLAADAAMALEACFDLAVGEGLVDRLGNGRFARELCRKAAALRDLRVYEVHGSSGVPSPEETTTLLMGDIMDAYQELKASAAP